MNAEIISVGTEILLGDIVNTNARYLSVELAALGISVYYQTVVGDNPQRLLDAYEIAFNRADLVITTGGLGPTEDDLTKEMGAKFFGKEMYVHEESLNKIKEFFKSQNLSMTGNNAKQAEFPEGSVIINNSKGTAPGCMIEENGKILIMIPGPPIEAYAMFENEVMPILKSKTNTILISKTLKICGVGESLVEDKIKDLIDKQTNPTIAPYAKTFEVALRITANAKDEEEANTIMKPTIDEIYNRLQENIYGEDETTLEASVINLLLKNNMTLAVCESCTGGMLTSLLVDYPGVSKVLLEGVVTYSNEAKINRLGVSKDLIEKYGAVSAEVAQSMVEGVAKTSGAAVAISTTGVAGPEGGTDDKPVGRVYAGFYINGEVITKEFSFKGDRQRIRNRTVVNVLDILRRELLKLK